MSWPSISYWITIEITYIYLCNSRINLDLDISRCYKRLDSLSTAEIWRGIYYINSFSGKRSNQILCLLFSIFCKWILICSLWMMDSKNILLRFTMSNQIKCCIHTIYTLYESTSSILIFTISWRLGSSSEKNLRSECCESQRKSHDSSSKLSR